MGIFGCKIPGFGNKSTVGIHTKTDGIYEWINALSVRLRNVRVVCGDWSRVCGGNWQDDGGNVGMFFDPPYSVTDRDTDIYHHDSTTVAQDVNAWVLKRGAKPTYRIVLAGYRDEHQNLLEHGWTEQVWKANGGYGNRSGNKNRERETLFFSPYCLRSQMSLFNG